MNGKNDDVVYFFVFGDLIHKNKLNILTLFGNLIWRCFMFVFDVNRKKGLNAMQWKTKIIFLKTSTEEWITNNFDVIADNINLFDGIYAFFKHIKWSNIHNTYIFRQKSKTEFANNIWFYQSNTYSLFLINKSLDSYKRRSKIV